MKAGLNMNSKSLWITEFGKDYDIPAEILNHPKMVDCSWHNDMCPHWENVSNPRLFLWVEHPNPELRELPMKRFLIGSGDMDILETDDVNAAIACFERLS
jgi:hypothetical protein